jgi:hypothetical protein
VKNRFSLNEVWAIIDQELDIDQYAERNLSHVVHRWIGEKHMHETGRNVGSGNQIVYTEKDIRRAIAYLRIQRVIGTVTGKVGSVVTRRLREIASYHRGGYAVAYLENGKSNVIVEWSEHGRDITKFLEGYDDTPFVVIPCFVAVFEKKKKEEPALNVVELDQMTDGNPYGH